MVTLNCQVKLPPLEQIVWRQVIDSVLCGGRFQSIPLEGDSARKRTNGCCCCFAESGVRTATVVNTVNLAVVGKTPYFLHSHFYRRSHFLTDSSNNIEFLIIS